MTTQASPSLSHDEMAGFWRWLRDEVDGLPGGLADNIHRGGCGDNYDAVSTKSRNRAEFCDLWSFADEDGHEWDQGKISANPNVRPPPGLDWDMLRDMGFIRQAHVWATTGGRHYDIEAPDGVDNPFDLNDIRRGMVETLRDKHPNLFARLSADPWWQASIRECENLRSMMDELEVSGPRP